MQGSEVEETARAFVAARRAARALDAYPGPVPPDLATAYRVQEAALGLPTPPIVGWKIAAIRPDLRDRFPAERLVGPVLADGLQEVADGASAEAGVYAGGFAAVEAEFAFRMGRSLNPRPEPYTAEEVVEAVASLHIAMEIASSPLAALSDLGPSAVISDQGNNGGLIVGPEIAGWRSRTPDSMTARMTIDDRVEGEGSAASIPGGPVAALLFLVNQLAGRGRSLAAGDYVSTGAATGVHKVGIGARARASFGDLGALSVTIVAKRASAEPEAPRSP